MRHWNIHDGQLVRRLRDELADEGASIMPGHEGGAAVYLDGCLIGVWLELQRDLFSFVPSGYLEPTRSCLPLSRVSEATRKLLDFERAERQQRRRA